MLKYIKIWFYFLKEIFFYSYMLVLNNIHLLFLIFVLTTLTLYWAHSKGVDNIWGISLALYARYVFITELVMINRKDQNMIDEIKSWSIITFLTKPISFVWFYFSQTYFIWIWLLSLISLMIALFAFIMEDSTFIRLLINKLYFIFWGLFFPLDIYPTWMKNIAEFFPFKYFLYAPAKFFTTWDMSFFRSYIPLQIMWLVIMFGVIYFMYSRVVRRLEINWW